MHIYSYYAYKIRHNKSNPQISIALIFNDFQRILLKTKKTETAIGSLRFPDKQNILLQFFNTDIAELDR